MAHGSVRWFFYSGKALPGNCSASHGDNWVFHCTFTLGGSGGSPSPAENWERYFSQQFLLRWGLLAVPPPHPPHIHLTALQTVAETKEQPA